MYYIFNLLEYKHTFTKKKIQERIRILVKSAVWLPH